MNLTMPNKREELLNRTHDFLQRKIDALMREFNNQLQKELLDEYRKNYPELKEFIDSIGFEIRVKRRFVAEINEKAAQGK